MTLSEQFIEEVITLESNNNQKIEQDAQTLKQINKTMEGNDE